MGHNTLLTSIHLVLSFTSYYCLYPRKEIERCPTTLARGTECLIDQTSEGILRLGDRFIKAQGILQFR